MVLVRMIRIVPLVLVFLAFGKTSTAVAFSLGIRPLGGLEIISIPSTKLLDPADPSKILSGDEKIVQRNLIFFGADVSAAVVEKGSLSLSAVLGFRMTNSAETKGTVNDTISMSYVPVGISVDFAMKKLRASGYFSYDLGIGPKFLLTAAQPSNSLDLKMSSLSRMRFGGLAEFFILKSLSVFGMGDYSMGSYAIAGGPLTIFNTVSNEDVPVKVADGTNKFKAVTFGGGVAYYIPVPASQRGEAESRPTPTKKSGGKPAPKKAKPPKPADGGAATGTPP
ncbi:MAG: hypothetical protein ACO3A4_00030 [Silvanigrellaceae bacterium]